MSPVRESSCPSCGAPVAFKHGSSAVVVCEYCDTVVARGDLKLEDLGKVAEIVDTRSPLAIGLRGRHEGRAFELLGRAQLKHPAGGVWDEWYALFADGRWGWLAEAQGRFFMTFEEPLLSAPAFDDVVVGEPVRGGGVAPDFVVAEKATAETAGAEGEIPYRLVPGEALPFADLSAPGGRFATLDWSGERPKLYSGREVTLADLGVAGKPAPERAARRVGAVKLGCPQCGGSLSLRAPDKTERVTCPQCGSLLDVNQGQLRFLKALDGAKVTPAIAIGTTGELGGQKLTVIGFMKRSVVCEGLRYFWEEYLLYEPSVGFRWLVRSDDHWSFVKPVAPGDVIGSATSSASFGGRRFKCFQAATATVEHVQGEFYWKVAQGERVFARDYVRPPEILTQEITRSEESPPPAPAAPPAGARRGIKKEKRPAPEGEINWSHGTYLEVDEVEQAFRVSLSRPTTVAPNQPFKHWAVYKHFGILIGVVFLLMCGVSATGRARTVYEKELAPLATVHDGARTFFSDSFELGGFGNVRVVVDPKGEPDFYANGELVTAETSRIVRRFGIPQTWLSSPDYASGALLAAPPAGKYTLTLEAHWENVSKPVAVNVRVEQGGAHDACCGCFTIVLLALIPFVIGIYHLTFESRRWQQSFFGA